VKDNILKENISILSLSFRTNKTLITKTVNTVNERPVKKLVIDLWLKLMPKIIKRYSNIFKL